MSLAHYRGRQRPRVDLFPTSPLEGLDPAHVAQALTGRTLPPMSLRCYDGGFHRLDRDGLLVLYLYPGGEDSRTADDVQHRAFANLHDEWLAREARVWGITTDSERELMQALMRGQLRHGLATDPELRLASALPLPSAPDGTRRRYQRITLIAVDTRIVHVFHPIRPERSGAQVLTWMQLHGFGRVRVMHMPAGNGDAA